MGGRVAHDTTKATDCIREDRLSSRKLYGSLGAFNAPLGREGLPCRPGPATRRSGAYRGGTHTRKLGVAESVRRS